MHPLPGAWEASTLDKIVSLRLLLEQMGHASGRVEANGVGLSCCFGFQAFHIALGCWSVCSEGIPAAMRSNHTCFQVTFIGLYGLLAFPAPSLSRVFSRPMLISGICVSPRSAMDQPTSSTSLSRLGSAGISGSHTRCWAGVS